MKESDRLAATADMLRVNGVDVDIDKDDLIVRGKGRAPGGGGSRLAAGRRLRRQYAAPSLPSRTRMNPDTIARLLIRCDDRPGIVAAATTFLYHHGANITELDQHSSSPTGGQLFMRIEFQTPQVDLPRAALEGAFAERVAAQYQMDWRMAYASHKPRMMAALACSSSGRCAILKPPGRSKPTATAVRARKSSAKPCQGSAECSDQRA